MKTGLLLFLQFLLVPSYSQVAGPQAEQDYVDEVTGYRITLIGDWRADTYTDAFRRVKTEFIHKNRDEAVLTISREYLKRRTINDVVRAELEHLKLCQPAVALSAQEPFEGGELSGTRLTFCYVEGEGWVAATYYFLQDRGTVWVLRLTGRTGFIERNRALTDRMARSFCPR
jgi:hypothetical protein